MAVKAAELREHWTGLGLGDDVIPISPGRKNPISDKWGIRPVVDQWARPYAEREKNPNDRPSPADCNIGLRFPNAQHIVMIDADDRKAVGTSARIAAELAARDIIPTTYQTASGGARFVLICRDALPVGQKDLPAEIGRGEFYVSSGQCVLPGSVLDHRRAEGDVAGPYVLSSDWTPPVVEWASLTWLLRDGGAPGVLADAGELPTAGGGLTLPVRLRWRDLPAWSGELLDALQEAGPGPVTTKRRGYPSRSEAEYAIIGAAVRAGWTVDDVKRLFEVKHPGHYITQGKGGRRRFVYLQFSWDKAVRALAGHPRARALADVWTVASGAPWVGGDVGRVNQAVFLGAVGLEYAGVGLGPDADGAVMSARMLAEAAGVNKMTASKALGRLQRAGLMVQTGRGRWRVNLDDQAQQNAAKRSGASNVNSSTLVHVTQCTSSGAGGARTMLHVSKLMSLPGVFAGSMPDLWSYRRRAPAVKPGDILPGADAAGADLQSTRRAYVGGLGRPARLILAAVLDAPDGLTVTGAAAAGGMTWNTAKSALVDLAAVGLVKRSGRVWVVGPAGLGDAESAVGALVIARKRRKRHAAERAERDRRARARERKRTTTAIPQFERVDQTADYGAAAQTVTAAAAQTVTAAAALVVRPAVVVTPAPIVALVQTAPIISRPAAAAVAVVDLPAGEVIRPRASGLRCHMCGGLDVLAVNGMEICLGCHPPADAPRPAVSVLTVEKRISRKEKQHANSKTQTADIVGA